MFLIKANKQHYTLGKSKHNKEGIYTRMTRMIKQSYRRMTSNNEHNKVEKALTRCTLVNISTRH